MFCRKYHPTKVLNSPSIPATVFRRFIKMGYIRENGEFTEYALKIASSNSIIGVDATHKPLPKLIARNAHVFSNAEVLEIGAGRGRIAKFALEKGVRKYIAIEPHLPFAKMLTSIKDPRLTVVVDLWENVRDYFVTRKFDVLVLWDVLMFVDLTKVHGGDYLHAVLREVEYFAKMTRRHILLSLHPVKGLIPKEHFKTIVQEFTKYGFEITDRIYLNYLLQK